MRVVCAQYAVRDGDPDHNLERSLQFIRRAAAEGADLIVLPELANSGCDLDSRERAPGSRGGDPRRPDRRGVEEGGGSVRHLRRRRAAGEGGDALYNSAVLLGPGVFGRYRKTHLWDEEKLVYEPGRRASGLRHAAGDDRAARLLRRLVPRGARTLAVKGAQILCVPSNAPDDWVPEHQRRGDLTMLDVHCIAAANANRVFVAAANRVGDGYLGRSCMVDATGGVLALAGATEEGLIHAEVDLNRARREKQLTDLSHSFEDRNPAVYEAGKTADREAEATLPLRSLLRSLPLSPPPRSL